MQETSKTTCFGLASLPALASHEYFVSLFALLVIQLFPKTFFCVPICNKTQPGLLVYCFNSLPLRQSTICFKQQTPRQHIKIGNIPYCFTGPQTDPTPQVFCFSGSPPLGLLSPVSSPFRGNSELVLKWRQLAIGQTQKH